MFNRLFREWFPMVDLTSSPRNGAAVRYKVWTGETNGIPDAVRNGFKPRIKIQVWVDVDSAPKFNNEF